METVTPDEGLRRFRPEPVVFVISVDEKGNPSGMVAGWCARLSYEPPLLGVALSIKARTHKLIQKSKEFVVSVPNKGLEKEVRFFGSTHGDTTDKFRETGIRTQPAMDIKTPLLKDATINYECKLENEIMTGDHILFIGRVVRAHIDKNKKVLLNMGRKGDKYVFEEFGPIRS